MFLSGDIMPVEVIGHSVSSYHLSDRDVTMLDDALPIMFQRQDQQGCDSPEMCSPRFYWPMRVLAEELDEITLFADRQTDIGLFGSDGDDGDNSNDDTAAAAAADRVREFRQRYRALVERSRAFLGDAGEAAGAAASPEVLDHGRMECRLNSLKKKWADLNLSAEEQQQSQQHLLDGPRPTGTQCSRILMAAIIFIPQ